MSRISKAEFEDGMDYCRIRKADKLKDDFDKGFESGFKYALEQFGIWKDGVCRIGCLDTPIKEILKEVGIQ